MIIYLPSDESYSSFSFHHEIRTFSSRFHNETKISARFDTLSTSCVCRALSITIPFSSCHLSTLVRLKIGLQKPADERLNKFHVACTIRTSGTCIKYLQIYHIICHHWDAQHYNLDSRHMTDDKTSILIFPLLCVCTMYGQSVRVELFLFSLLTTRHLLFRYCERFGSFTRLNDQVYEENIYIFIVL